LVAQAAGNAVQRLLRDTAYFDAQAPRIALDLDDARIPRPRLEQHLTHVVPVMLDGRSHRIDPRDPLTVLAHGHPRKKRNLATDCTDYTDGKAGPCRRLPACENPICVHLCDLWLVLLLLALGGLAARGWRGRFGAGLGFDQAEVDLAFLEAGAQDHDA